MKRWIRSVAVMTLVAVAVGVAAGQSPPADDSDPPAQAAGLEQMAPQRLISHEYLSSCVEPAGAGNSGQRIWAPALLWDGLSADQATAVQQVNIAPDGSGLDLRLGQPGRYWVDGNGCLWVQWADPRVGDGAADRVAAVIGEPVFQSTAEVFDSCIFVAEAIGFGVDPATVTVCDPENLP